MRWSSLALPLLLLAGCGGGDDDDDGATADAAGDDHDAGAPDAARPREVVRETLALVAGELAEGIFTGGPADRAVIRLDAPVAELDWNIHGHDDGGTQTVYEELDRMTVEYDFAPPAEAQWWLLLRNSGEAAMDVEIEIELHGALQWEWQ